MNIGSIFEVDLGETLGYIMYTHKSERFGYVIWLLSRRYKERPKDVLEGFKKFDSTPTFFPLSTAVHDKLILPIGSSDVPLCMKKFPLFVTGVVAPEIGLMQPPGLWDGENDLPFPEGALRTDYPPKQIIMFPVLCDRLREFPLDEES
jgi:hypothetical protein